MCIAPQETLKFSKLFRKTVEIAKGNTLLIVGDFNAHHTEWGYKRSTIKGRYLWLDVQREGLSLLNDPLYPTRIGNSVSGNTTPDLTFSKNTPTEATWLNTQENLGSDHYLVTIGFESGVAKSKSGKILRLIDWDAFRALRAEERGLLGAEDGTSEVDITDIESWAEQLHADAKRATKLIPEEAELQQAGSKLLHMWEAKQSLHKRLQKQNFTESCGDD